MTLQGTVMNTAIVVSLTGFSAMLLYFVLRRRDDEEDDGIDFGDQSVRRQIESQPVTMDIPISKDSVGIVIGRQGCTIKNIQEKSKAKIKFKDDGGQDGPRMCSISGTKESVEFAQVLIQDQIRNQPLITTSEIYVPVKAIGRIIGRCGENIHAVVVASGAKINVDNVAPKDQYAPRRVMLKGTTEQINTAKLLIEAKVAEDNDLRKRYEAGAASRSPRKNKSPQYLMAAERVEPEDEVPHAERLDPINSDESLEVYMSAVENPGQFWVQILSPSAAELDQLVQQMTDYYSKLENQELHSLHEVCLGQLVAAPFHQDKKWYRAQVVNMTINDYDPQESEVELFYVDYGDSYEIEQRQLMELRTDFLKLRPQAIECSLAKVSPIGGQWSDEATDLFEELTENAQWKVITCKVNHYDPNIQRKQDRGRREGSPVPVVELFNISGVKDINIGDELVKNQFAVYTSPSHAPVKDIWGVCAQSEKEYVPIPFVNTSRGASHSEVGLKTEPNSKMVAYADKAIGTHGDDVESACRSFDELSQESDQWEAFKREPKNKMAADALKAIKAHAVNVESGNRSLGKMSQRSDQSDAGKREPKNKMAADALKAIKAHADNVESGNRSLRKMSQGSDQSEAGTKINPQTTMAAHALKAINMHAEKAESANKSSDAMPRGSNKSKGGAKSRPRGKMLADMVKANNSSSGSALRRRLGNGSGDAPTNGPSK